MIRDFAWYEQRNINLVTETLVTSVNADERVVVTNDGKHYPYHALLIASGGWANPLRVPGADGTKHIYNFVTLDDTKTIIESMLESRTALAYGGSYQLKGIIARDQLDYATAEKCFKQASLLAQEAGCVELNALTMARQAVMYMWQKRLDAANQLYETAREISRRSPPALRVYLATGHAEVQGLRGDSSCLVSLTNARSLLRRVDAEDDYLLLLRSTRCSEQSISDGWLQCHTLLGRPEIAIEGYDRAEKLLDLGMIRKSARLNIQYAEALFVSKDLSCCFYASEGLKIARSVGSQYNLWRVKNWRQSSLPRFHMISE
jgi:tetratricopeptide (TPR) repeat protein